jgi:hypothetical protein
MCQLNRLFHIAPESEASIFRTEGQDRGENRCPGFWLLLSLLRPSGTSAATLLVSPPSPPATSNRHIGPGVTAAAPGTTTAERPGRAPLRRAVEGGATGLQLPPVFHALTPVQDNLLRPGTFEQSY